MAFKLVPFQPGMEADFYRLHCPANDAGWCHCVAWWVNGWDGWGERTAEQNRQLRQTLLSDGEYDGYLLYEAGKPVGWCQVGRRDRLKKLVTQMELDPDPAVWALTCFFVAPASRGQGVAGQMLRMVLADLKQKNIERVEAYPKQGETLDALDLWNGPEKMYISAGFGFVKAVGQRVVLRLEL